jgi:tRNA-2-methylthio-N6-dimethylallyladenosine synthase
LDEVQFSDAFMYYYNVRAGTAAAAFPEQVPLEIKKERLARVIERQRASMLQLKRGRLGQRAVALVEGPSKKRLEEILCRTEHDEAAVIEGIPVHRGSFVEITLSGLEGNTFRATEATLCHGE